MQEESPNKDNRPLTGREQTKNNEAKFICALIGIIGWVGLIVGVGLIFASPKHGGWMYGLATIASSAFLLGFSAIVKAAYKYLDK